MARERSFHTVKAVGSDRELPDEDKDLAMTPSNTTDKHTNLSKGSTFSCSLELTFHWGEKTDTNPKIYTVAGVLRCNKEYYRRKRRVELG